MPSLRSLLACCNGARHRGAYSEPYRGSCRRMRCGIAPKCMQFPQPDIIEHFGNADAVPQLFLRRKYLL